MIAPGAARKFSAFVEAVRGYFGLALSRAVALRKAMKDGTVSEADHDAFLPAK